MVASTEYDLIYNAMSYALWKGQETEQEVHAQLETRASTSLVNALRTVAMHNCVTAIGGFSIFESTLQMKRGWRDAFRELERNLRENGRDELADRFNDYKLAVNVLKHGRGASYDRLIAKCDQLPFRVKAPDQRYFDEGDVTEGLRLIRVDSRFVEQCASIIIEVVQALKEIHGW